MGRDLANAAELPGIKVENGELAPSQDGKKVTWTGPARFEARAAAPRALPGFITPNGALRFDVLVPAAPSGKVKLGYGTATVDVTRLLAGMAGKKVQTVSVPLSCFKGAGAIDTPFSVEASGPFAAVFGNIALVGDKGATAVACSDLQ